MNATRRTVVVIGAGMVGVCTASFLRRDGHDVSLIDPNEPGEGASFGNAGGLNSASIVPMSMPGTAKNVPKWLLDPLGPLAIRWHYLPSLAPAERSCAARRPGLRSTVQRCARSGPMTAKSQRMQQCSPPDARNRHRAVPA